MKTRGGVPLDEFVCANRIFSSLSMRSFDITICLCQQFASAKERVGSSSTFFRSSKAKPNQSFKIVSRGVNK